MLEVHHLVLPVRYQRSTSKSDPSHFYYPSALLAPPWRYSDAYPTQRIRQVGQPAEGVYGQVQAPAGSSCLTIAACLPACIVNNDDRGDSAASIALAHTIARPVAGRAYLTWVSRSRSAGCSFCPRSTRSAAQPLERCAPETTIFAAGCAVAGLQSSFRRSSSRAASRLERYSAFA